MTFLVYVKCKVRNNVKKLIREILRLFVRPKKCSGFYLSAINPSTILVFRLEHIGDVMTAIPALRALREKFPKSKITLLHGSWSKEIAENIDYVDELLCFDFPYYDRNRENVGIKGMLEVFSFLKNIRKNKYDLLVDFRGDSFHHMFLPFLTRAKIKIGYDLNRLGFFFNYKVPYRNGIHDIERALDVVRALGADTKDLRFSLKISDSEKNWCADFLSKHSIANNMPFITMHAAAPWAIRRWSEKKFGELCEYILQKYGIKIRLVGSKSDSGINMSIINNSGNGKDKIVKMEGENLKKLSYIIEKSILFIGVDSAPMHIAYSVNTPILALFGPGDMARWAPRGPYDIVLSSHPDCSPCDQFHMHYPDGACETGKPVCMENLHLDIVKDAVDKQLERLCFI